MTMYAISQCARKVTAFAIFFGEVLVPFMEKVEQPRSDAMSYKMIVLRTIYFSSILQLMV